MEGFPFCPNLDCSFHDKAPEHSWFYRYGSYVTQAFGIISRFRCSSCGTTFSRQTFSTHYYAKKLVDLAAVFERQCEAQSERAIARSLVFPVPQSKIASTGSPVKP